MVDVSAKGRSDRQAEASAFVAMSPQVLSSLASNPKGDPLETARLAGIMAAKKTSELIPLCHPLPLTHIDVKLQQCETAQVGRQERRVHSQEELGLSDS